ncbi:bifunctional lysine ketoglutarate reductase /saccharopine dehydrogenase family protein [Candidatus Bipolaricaulota bacterium]
MRKSPCVGVRREDMYQWERRTPLTPAHIKELAQGTNYRFIIQSSDKRAYSDQEYQDLDLSVAADLKKCPIIIALKEIPVDVLEKDKVYVFFSHVIKGQASNMPMLQRALDLGCTIIDYERIVDDDQRRLIAFGNYAGLAGMIDTLWALGDRLRWEGIANPFERLSQASEFADLAEAKAAIRSVGEAIRTEGLPEAITPLAVGIAGYGNVSKGAQEILDLLPVSEVDASDLLTSHLPANVSNTILKVVFREEDTVLPLVEGKVFELQELYDHPERYRAAFDRYLPHLTVLVNCIYWEARYPRLITVEAAKALYASGKPKLRVIGDISCDVEGGIEITVKATESDDPVYVYDPKTGSIHSGVEGHGPVMMVVDILPSELPRESSAYFSNILKGFVPEIVTADYSADYGTLNLPASLKRAVICHHGALTPDYQYISKHLTASATPSGAAG